MHLTTTGLASLAALLDPLPSLLHRPGEPRRRLPLPLDANRAQRLPHGVRRMVEARRKLTEHVRLWSRRRAPRTAVHHRVLLLQRKAGPVDAQYRRGPGSPRMPTWSTRERTQILDHECCDFGRLLTRHLVVHAGNFVVVSVIGDCQVLALRHVDEQCAVPFGMPTGVAPWMALKPSTRTI
jgi:hypothetical protein